jgi:hypothetical protein
MTLVSFAVSSKYNITNLQVGTDFRDSPGRRGDLHAPRLHSWADPNSAAPFLSG